MTDTSESVALIKALYAFESAILKQAITPYDQVGATQEQAKVGLIQVEVITGQMMATSKQVEATVLLGHAMTSLVEATAAAAAASEKQAKSFVTATRALVAATVGLSATLGVVIATAVLVLVTARH
jgi:hypothetical protein